MNDRSKPLAMQVNRNYDFRQSNSNYRGRKCDYCHLLGHTKKTCYKLVGYPNDWKNRKKQGYNSNFRSQYIGSNNLSTNNDGNNFVNTGHRSISQAQLW